MDMASHLTLFGCEDRVIQTFAAFILSTIQWVPTLEIKSNFNGFVVLSLRGVAWADRLPLELLYRCQPKA